MSLIIKKTIGGVFVHIDPSTGNKLDGNPNATAVGNLVNVKTRNGSVMYLDVDATTVTVIDDNTASSDTYPDATSLFERLKAIGYFNQGDGTIIGGTFVSLLDTSVTSPTDGQIPVWRGGFLVNEDITAAFGVNSWNGLTGNVVVTTDNFPEGVTNLYFTDARVEANPEVALNIIHRDRLDNPHQVTKTQVGLSNVDNTTDINKPISIAQENRYVSIEDKIGIIKNGNFATLANVSADVPLQTLITDNPGVPIAVLNEDGRIYLYDTTLSEWRENKSEEVFLADNISEFPVTGDLDTLYKVRGATPALYNWNGFNYEGIGDDGKETPISRGDAIEDIEPTAGEVPFPINGDSATVYLTDGKLEKWLYSTIWTKVFVAETGGGGGATNLSYTQNATNGIVTSSTGTDATIPLGDENNAGLVRFEEGTFTPTITGSAGSAISYTLENAIYYKIGKLVYYHIFFSDVFNTGTDPTFFNVNNMPFPASPGTQPSRVGYLRNFPNDDASTLVGRITSSAIEITKANGELTAIQFPSASSSFTEILISGTYLTN